MSESSDSKAAEPRLVHAAREIEDGALDTQALRRMLSEERDRVRKLLRQRESLKNGLRKVGREQKALRATLTRLNVELDTARKLLGMSTEETERFSSHPPERTSRPSREVAMQSGFVTLAGRGAERQAPGDPRTADTVPPPRVRRRQS